MSDLGEHLVSTAAQALLPLLTRLLAAGVPFGQLEGRLRELFVEVARRSSRYRGGAGPTAGSQLLTGINRRKVRRIRAAERGHPGPSSFGMNHATSLISRWLTDPRTVDRRGRPRPLPYQAGRAAEAS